jgi:hypothetical protein
MADENSQPRANGYDWTFLSNHATVLLCIAQEPEIRLREVAERVRIVADLEHAGYLSRVRRGRRNHYKLHADRPFRHPVVAPRDVSLLLYLMLGPSAPPVSEKAN